MTRSLANRIGETLGKSRLARHLAKRIGEEEEEEEKREEKQTALIKLETLTWQVGNNRIMGLSDDGGVPL